MPSHIKPGVRISVDIFTFVNYNVFYSVQFIMTPEQTGLLDRRASLTDRPTWQTGLLGRQASLADRPNSQPVY